MTMTNETRFPIWLSDRNNPDRVVKLEESDDGQGIVLTVRDEDGESRRYYDYAGGAWMLNADGTVGRQLVGINDVTVPRHEDELRAFFHEASSQDVD
jgi:hypothetical protein